MTSPATTLASTDSLTLVRRAFQQDRTHRRAWRREQLRGIERLCDEQESEIAASLEADLGRSPAEAWLGNIASTSALPAMPKHCLTLGIS